ncbi:hypothetical protein HanHA300_Chr16g0602961 [Helianthus annuus]|nr:hypothetical protein HanHA300_Chr16g0602961 [Helianthus annuus]KAJ0459828.1 hypothetical protein HanHA89_Chr16g0653491 [Helianthus annuus]
MLGEGEGSKLPMAVDVSKRRQGYLGFRSQVVFDMWWLVMMVKGGGLQRDYGCDDGWIAVGGGCGDMLVAVVDGLKGWSLQGDCGCGSGWVAGRC